MTLALSSPAFKNDGKIPAKYTCDEDRFLSPPLQISGAPADTQSFALIMDDPDVPQELIPRGVFTHWVLFDIPRDTSEVKEGEKIGTIGNNERGEARYTGPCPPGEYEPSEHRYILTLYALDTTLSLSSSATKQQVVDAMHGHILEQTELIGRYKRGAA